MTSEWSKRQKKQLRALAALAYERELTAALGRLEAEFGRWRGGEIGPFELSDLIHRFHNGEARDLYKRYESINWPEAAIAYALHHGLLTREEVGEEYLAGLEGLIHALAPE